MPLQVSAAALDQASNKHTKASRANMNSVCRSALSADSFMRDVLAIAFVDAFTPLAPFIVQLSQLGAYAADLETSGIIHKLPSRLCTICVYRDGIQPSAFASELSVQFWLSYDLRCTLISLLSVFWNCPNSNSEFKVDTAFNFLDFGRIRHTPSDE